MARPIAKWSEMMAHIHSQREVLTSERRRLRAAFASMMVERRALIANMRAAARHSRVTRLGDRHYGLRAGPRKLRS
jgi:hypothetical protein